MNKDVSNQGAARPAIVAWCLYDWANTAFSTVIVTFIYSVFFEKSVIGDPDRGSAIWAWGLAASGIMTAILAPLAGAMADHYGMRQRWLGIFLAISVTATALMWFGLPSPAIGNVLYILALLAIAGTATELGGVIANAMLPDLASSERLGRISGWAWACGYAGGLCCLVLALFGLVGLGAVKPLLLLPHEQGLNIRAVTLLVAGWCLLFSLPLLRWGPHSPRTAHGLVSALRAGLHDLRETLIAVRAHGNLIRLLVASALYRDGLNTLFAVGGLYAAGTLHMDFQELLIFAIGLNITAGLGAFGFAFIDDKFGSKPTILISLLCLLALGAAILLVTVKVQFLVLALLLGIFMGPVQAASRTLVARLAPPEMMAQAFGLYALTGKSLAFLGPLLFGWATWLAHSQRVGMATILLFWLAGLVIMWGVKENRTGHGHS